MHVLRGITHRFRTAWGSLEYTTVSDVSQSELRQRWLAGRSGYLFPSNARNPVAALNQTAECLLRKLRI